MAVYFILTQTINDLARYQNEYIPAVQPYLRKYAAEVLVAEHSATPVQGEPAPSVVVIKFPSEAMLRGFLDDPDDQPVKNLRLAITANAHAVMAREYRSPSR